MSYKNIYFAPTPWAASQSVENDFRFQTPNRSGIWQDLKSVDDYKDADFLIVQDQCSDSEILNYFNENKIIYVNREATINYLKKQKNRFENTFSFWDGSGYLPVRWAYQSEGSKNVGMNVYSGIEYDYDALLNLKKPHKDLKICSILSDKSDTKGHRIRKKFTRRYMKRFPLDVYGSFKHSNKDLIMNSKFQTLLKYKYCLGFDNQDSINDFIGTQFTDAVLAWTVPIFWCGTDLSRYYPERSFIQFDARDSDEIDRIQEIINEDDFDARLPYLQEARNLILNKYNLWPTLEKIIEGI